METEIKVVKGDITKIEVDAIVNAANKSLVGGGGVDGAIHRAGGGDVMKECDYIRDKYGGCPVGEAVITKAGLLPAKYVIHTVGPIWRGGNNNEVSLLYNAYYNSLSLAVKNNIKTISFPNISTGVYGFPKDKAYKIVLKSVGDFLKINNTKIDKIIFVCFDEENYQLYKNICKFF